MSLEIPFGIKTVNPVKVEYWGGPYNSIVEALSTIPIEVRYLTMEVSILDSVNGNEKYWFKDSILDSGLVKFASGGSGQDFNGYTSGQTDALLLLKVDKTQKINGYVLTGDTVISAHDTGAFTSGETIELINNYSGTTEVYIGPDSPPKNESLWVETDSDGTLIGEVYVGPLEPTNGQTLWIDTDVNSSFVFNSSSLSEITPDFESDFYKVDSNYGAGNAVSISNYLNLPMFDASRLLVVKNLSSNNTVFVPNLSNQISSGITYSFIRMNPNNILVPSDKIVEITYKFFFTGISTCVVTISHSIQQ